MTSGYTNYLINKEQEKLETLYDNPDFLNPVKLQPHLTHEENLMELVSNDD